MIYLCRHGQTDYNRDGRVQGRIESRLTSLGERQAAAMGELLHRSLGDQIGVPWRLVSSPLLRARATAEIIGARLGLPVETEPRLTEVMVGAWEGRLYADLAQQHHDLLRDNAWFFRAPGAETYEAVLERVSDWLKEQEDELRRRLVVVSHGVAGRLLRGVYGGLSRVETLQQDVPQDAIHRLSEGTVQCLRCDPVD